MIIYKRWWDLGKYTSIPPVKEHNSEPAFVLKGLLSLYAHGKMVSFPHHCAFFPWGSTRWPAMNTVMLRRPMLEKEVFAYLFICLLLLLSFVTINPLKYHWYLKWISCRFENEESAVSELKLWVFEWRFLFFGRIITDVLSVGIF